MTRSLTLAALAGLLGVALAGPAQAQSIGAPAGRPAATAPGGTEGIAGPANIRRAIRSGKAVRAPRYYRRRR